jgi:serine O-acetyltransferase
MFETLRRDYANHDRNPLHPGLWALAVYRYGHWSLQRRSRVTRVISGKVYGVLMLLVQIITGNFIERHATLGQDFRMIGPGPVHIHPRATIGDRCVVMPGVTIAGAGDGTDAATVGDDVVFGPRATTLGPVQIGDRARIGGNSLIIGNVRPNAVMIGVPARSRRGGMGCFIPMPEPATED